MQTKPLSLLERKRIQWEKEKEELMGLGSPWGRPSYLKNSNSCTSLMDDLKMKTTPNNSNPTIVTSSYLSSLRINSQSECHLPPIGFENVRDKKEMELHDWLNRKHSLPIHGESRNMSIKDINFSNSLDRKYEYRDEEPYTSGYQSEINPYESRNSSGDSDKDPRLFKRYMSNGHLVESLSLNSNREKTYMYTSEVESNNTWSKPQNYLYSKRNEMDHYNQETIDTGQKTRGHIPPAAMRSSFTNCLEAPDKDAYNDIKKQEHEQWLKDLEKQREEQRIRKQMDKEEKNGRAKWGDRGVIVGHLWEPATISNSHLPSPNEGRKSNDQETETESGQRTFLLGQNIQLDSQEILEREKKRIQALQHQESIKRQMEERQERLRREREKRLEEEREEDAKILMYQLEQLKKLEMNEREKLIQEQENEIQEVHHYDKEHERNFENENIATLISELQNPCLIRKNLSTSFTLPPINSLESSSVNSIRQRSRSRSPFEEHEATVVPVSNKPTQICIEVGTQTEEIEMISIMQATTSQNLESKNSEKSVPKMKKRTNQDKERPKWGVAPPTKQYVKQSEKDPHYLARLQKRNERLRRREMQLRLSKEAHGNESDDSDGHGVKIRSTLPKTKQRSKFSDKEVSNDKLFIDYGLSETGIKTEQKQSSTMKRKAKKSSTTIINNEERKTWHSNRSIENFEDFIKYESATDSMTLDRTSRRMSQNSIVKEYENQNVKEKSLKIEDSYSSDQKEDNDTERHGHLEQWDTKIQQHSWVEETEKETIHSECDDEQINQHQHHKFTGNRERELSSPPVPALLKKMTQEKSTRKKSVMEKSIKNKADLELESSNITEEVNVSPHTVFIESSAQYFTNTPPNSSSNFSHHSNIPLSPPPHLKNLMYRLETLGNYMPHDDNKNRTIEFRIKVPADCYLHNLHRPQILDEYNNSCSEDEDKEENGMSWLQAKNSENGRILSQLSMLRKNQDGLSDSNKNSPTGSTFYPSSSEKSLSP